MPNFHLVTILIWLIFTALVFLGFTLVAASRYRDGVFQHEKDFPVLIILPCRGVDYRFEENLKALREIEYKHHRIVAVVDDMNDPSVPYLRSAGIEIAVSRAECSECRGKVRAIATILEIDIDEEIIVVLDSDTMVGKKWLYYLTEPFNDSKIGVTTTFPVFVADGGFWSVIKTAWGMVGSGMMESKITRFVWGGSMAFRKSLITNESLQFFKKNVSDDVAIMRICKNAGFNIEYVKKAAPKIYSNEGRNDFIEWSNRQTALSVSGSPAVLKYGIIFYVLDIFLLISAILLSIFVYPLFILFTLPYFLTAIKNARRSITRKAAVFAITFITPFFYLSNLIIASRMRSIKWRGRSYGLP